MTRDESREQWAASGLNYAFLTKDNLERLRQGIGAKMKLSGLIRGSYRVQNRATLKSGYADIRCTAFYFKDRQAVTFEEGGFIGFAGWADDENVQPILEAFTEWLQRETSNQAA